MDLDLWGPPCEPEGGNLYTQPEWQCDFYFGYVYDAIEEDALNEKWCIQVLRILITKADSEIDELEEDLIFLQSELAWAENAKWFDICCSALIEKINCLDISMKSLWDKDKNDVEVHLLMHTQPVERLYEILKALLSEHFCKKDEQAEEVNDASILSSDVPKQVIEVVDENKRSSNDDSKFIASEEIKKSNSIRGRGATLSPSIKQQEKKTSNPKNFKPANGSLKDSNPCSPKLSAGLSDEVIPSSYIGTKKESKGEDKEHGFSPNGYIVIQSSSSKSADKEKCSVENIKAQPANVGVSNSISGAKKYTVDNSNEKKKSSNSDSAVVSEEIREHDSISTTDVILDMSLEPTVNRTDPDKKLANAIAKDLCLNANRHSTGDLYEMKILCEFNVEVSENEEYCCRASSKSITSSSLVNPDGKGIQPRKDELAEELRCVTDQNREGNFDKEQKLSDFTLKAALKHHLKELKVTAVEKVVSSNYAQKTQKNLLQVLKMEPAFSDSENSALTSLLDMQDKEGKNAIKLQIKEDGETMAEAKINEFVTHEENANIPILQEIGLSTIEVDSSSSSNQDWKTTKKVLVYKENDVSEENPNSVSQPQKKRKKSSNSISIITEVKELNPEMDLYNSVESCSMFDWIPEATASLPSALILGKMSLAELRVIAKRQKLPKYYKLSKKSILQQLAGRMGDC